MSATEDQITVMHDLELRVMDDGLEAELDKENRRLIAARKILVRMPNNQPRLDRADPSPQVAGMDIRDRVISKISSTKFNIAKSAQALFIIY